MEKSLEHYVELKRLVDVYYDVQDVRIRTANRLRLLPQKTGAVYPSRLKEVEKSLKNQIEALLEQERIYTEWLKKIKGIGPCLGGGLLANIMVRFATVDSLKECDELQQEYAMKTKDKAYLVPEMRGIKEFPTISKLWAFSGMHVVDGKAPKRKRGAKINWNPKMRVLCWKLGKSFVMVGDFYKSLYRQFKEAYMQREDLKKGKGWKGHIDMMARRKTVKVFLQHLWLKWRQLEGLEVTQPYAINKLGHKSYISPPI